MLVLLLAVACAQVHQWPYQDMFSTAIVTVAEPRLVLRFTLPRPLGSYCKDGQCVQCSKSECCIATTCYNIDTLSFHVQLWTGGGHLAGLVPATRKQCDVPIVSGASEFVVVGDVLPTLQVGVAYHPQVSLVDNNTTSVVLEGPRGARIDVALPSGPTDVEYTIMDTIGLVTVSWRAPTSGNVPIMMYRVESLQGTAFVCISRTSPCKYSTAILGDTYQFMVTPVTLIGTGSPSVPSEAVPVDTSAPQVLVQADVVLIKWAFGKTNLRRVLTAVPSVGVPCKRVSEWSCEYPLAAFDRTKTYQFQVVSLTTAGAIRSLSPLSTASNFNQGAALSVGAIVGIAVGGTCALGVAFMVVYLLHRKWTSGAFHRALDDEKDDMYYKF